ncbi:glycoside hydrolase family protein [Azospirillum melinis]|uniref:Lysozyme n=1 Tax=Azospirillum melinis TaxID=328839 RepID=A0ABX2KLZ7_9PROT|nr:lysozyme [Azospirillum melinis]NUB03756.1 glycoside hydrolase family protein [Azospirillum melinis]
MIAKPFVSLATIALVQHFEGLYLEAYLCPAGVPTIGYGHTAGVELGQVITRVKAEEFLLDDMSNALAQVDALVKVPVTDDQRGALGSFTFNLGAGNLASSTLLKRLNLGDVDGAGREFARWTKAKVDGRTIDLPGLVARRAAEAALFAGGDWMAAAGTSSGGLHQSQRQPQMAPAPAGAEADRVIAIQRKLAITADGIYGPATTRAVQTWQRNNGLVADGIVGPRTAAAMGL